MRKRVVVFLIVILFAIFAFVYLSGMLNPFKYALPGQPCGGSTLRAKKCIPGFTCKFSFPECGGCGGVCIPNKK